jgi:hypothetical protein
MAAGLPVVVRRIPANRHMLPEDWQFDDAQSAVAMIRALTRQPTRLRRVREQFDLLAELRKNSPELVLSLEYRRLLQKSKATRAGEPRTGTYYFSGRRLPNRHDSPLNKENRCGRHYSAS